MDLAPFERKTDFEWRIRPFGRMQVPGVIFASETLLRAMDAKVYEQVCNVAMLPGIVEASRAMPDAHWGYGFAIGGVAAFDADAGGVVSEGGVGFDISCGVRTLHTGLRVEDIEAVKARLADALYRAIPAGMGSTGAICLDAAEMDAMLLGGARWAGGAVSATRPTWNASRKAAVCAAPNRRRSPARPGSASATRWARWVQATIISRCSC
jgi:tRNA-splicing ligase RtcB